MTKIVATNCLTAVYLGVSGFEEATSHWELSNNLYTNTAAIWGHRIVAVLEAIPLLGKIVALIEHIVCYIKERFFSPSVQTNELDPSIAKTPLDKMWKNAKKAIEEAVNKPRCIYRRDTFLQKDDTSVYASVEEALPDLTSLTQKSNRTPLTITSETVRNKGTRTSMEDDDCVRETDKGFVACVFDGHGGGEVSRIASMNFGSFLDRLEEKGGDVRETITTLIEQTNQDVARESDAKNQGSTAVICFVDKKTHLVYTTTLGDSEANVYRNINGQLKSIPLSCTRDWGSEKDAKRAADGWGMPGIAESWPKYAQPKHLRYAELNVSRALGDLELSPVVSHKPKITVNQLQPGDILMLACDGLKDFVSEADIIRMLQEESRDSQSVANRLVRRAIKEYQSNDNITVTICQIS